MDLAELERLRDALETATGRDGDLEQQLWSLVSDEQSAYSTPPFMLDYGTARELVYKINATWGTSVDELPDEKCWASILTPTEPVGDYDGAVFGSGFSAACALCTALVRRLIRIERKNDRTTSESLAPNSQAT